MWWRWIYSTELTWLITESRHDPRIWWRYGYCIVLWDVDDRLSKAGSTVELCVLFRHTVATLQWLWSPVTPRTLRQQFARHGLRKSQNVVLSTRTCPRQSVLGYNLVNQQREETYFWYLSGTIGVRQNKIFPVLWHFSFLDHPWHKIISFCSLKEQQ